jgi:Trypsin
MAGSRLRGISIVPGSETINQKELGGMRVVSPMILRCLICCAAALGGAIAWLGDAGAAQAATVHGHHRLADTRWWSGSERHGRSTPSGRRGGSYRARAAVVGGSLISIDSAPWQVAILGKIPIENQGQTEYFYPVCGGAILAETRVITAAHCMFNPQTGEPAPAEDFVVVAGSSDILENEPTAQDIFVEGIRVHPYFNYAEGPDTPDDVAILLLERSLNLTGPAAQAIGVVPAGPTPPEGTQANLAGYGLQSATEEPNGKLYSLSMGVGLSEQCGGEADAVFVCASAPGGSACLFDEGGGLTSTGPTPMLLGVLATFEGYSRESCPDGSVASFTNLAAPEIRDFIESETLPPEAPRGGAGLKVAGVPEAGNALTCSPGSWNGGPTFTYAFVDSAEGQVLQSGSSPTYQLTAADVGRTILCQVQAANAGGTATEQTVALPAIKAAPAPKGLPPSGGGGSSGSGPPPPPPTPVSPTPLVSAPAATSVEEISLAGKSLSVSGGGVALVRLECSGGTAECAGKLTLTAKETKGKHGHKSSRTITIGTAKFTIEPQQTTTVKIDLDAEGRALLDAEHGQLSASLTISALAPGAGQPQARSVDLILKHSARKARKRKK